MINNKFFKIRYSPSTYFQDDSGNSSWKCSTDWITYSPVYKLKPGKDIFFSVSGFSSKDFESAKFNVQEDGTITLIVSSKEGLKDPITGGDYRFINEVMVSESVDIDSIKISVKDGLLKISAQASESSLDNKEIDIVDGE